MLEIRSPDLGRRLPARKTSSPVAADSGFALTPRLGCLPGIATGEGSLDYRAVEFLEYWRLHARPLEPTSRTHLHFRGHDPDPALPRMKAAPYVKELALAAPRGVLYKWHWMKKLTLEFAGQPGYPEVQVTVVNAVVREMQRHQTLAIV
jgi:hypothetical protein